MAKKLNKKVVIIGAGVLTLLIIAGSALTIRHFARRNPERNLENARLALAEGDYRRAERLFGWAYAYGKTDAWKTELLFEMADFHLIHNEQHEANWPKALSCWNTVLNISPQNIPARRNLMQYFYEMADSGASGAWRNVYDNASELIKLSTDNGDDADAETLLAYGRAALSIARRGGTADRREYLTQALETFETLVKREPAVALYYSYLADAIQLRGELDAQAGFLNARQRAEEEALKTLDTAVQQADDKASALAARLTYDLQSVGNDSDKIEALRADFEARTRDIAPNAKLLTVLSQAYEIPGGGSAQAELNRAIEYARQALRLDPEEFEHNYRLMGLLYRKGSAFEDAAAMEDAVHLAESMKSLPQTQDIPGPRQSLNAAYRNAVNVFLSRYYLETALDRPDEAQAWTAKAEPLVSQIAQYYGSSEHVAVQQWQGMLMLAKGERDRAVRLLFRAYEQAKALDAPDQPSGIDPVLCMVLARVAKEDNQVGLHREFLEKAMANRSRIMLDRPSLTLDYAELMTRFQAWQMAALFANGYQSRYGVSARSRNIVFDAMLAMGEIDDAREIAAALPEDSVDRKTFELRVLSSQITQTSRQIALLEAEGQTPSAEVLDTLDTLLAQQKQLFTELIRTAPEDIDGQHLYSACVNYIRKGKTEDAVTLLDAFLAERPEEPSPKALRLQIEEPNPLSMPTARYVELQIQAIETVQYPKSRALAKASVYRAAGEVDKAVEMLNLAAEADKENDGDIIREKFNIAIDREDVKSAEELWRMIRARNLDGCEGNLSAAQLELIKKNYVLALRRADEALAIKPLSSFAYYLKSRIYQEMEDMDAALQSSRQATRMDPLNSQYSKNHASILFERNNTLGLRVTSEEQNELTQAIITAIVLNPNDWQLQSVYAEVISRESPDRALAIRRQLFQNHPSTANAVMLGNMALRMAQDERDVAKRSGLIELSGQAYTQALSREPDNETVKAAYAEYLRVTQQSEKAEELLRDDKNLLWRYYLQNGQYEKAQQVLDELHRADDRDISVLRGLVLTNEGAGNRTEFKRYLDMLAALDHDKDGELWVLQKYLDAGYIEDVSGRLASFRERHPDEKLVLLLEALAKMSGGLFDEAMTLTNRYLESDSENAMAWRLRGRLHRLMNQVPRAVEDLQRSKSLQPNPAIRMELAALYSEMRQTDAAIGELVAGMQDSQVPIQMRITLESLYKNANRINELERFYNQMIEQFPDTPLWPMRAGQFYLSRNEPAKAVPYLKQAWDMIRRHQAMDPTALSLYLEAMLRNRAYNDVSAVASEMLDSPLAPVAYAYLGKMHAEQGNKERAESFFITALDKSGPVDLFQETVLSMIIETSGQDTAVRWIQNNPDTLPALLLGYRLAVRNEQFNRGIELIDRCLAAADPAKPEWNNFTLKKANLLIQAFMKTADRSYLDRAMVLFKEILEHYPNNPSILNNLAYLMATNNEQIDQAVQYASRAHLSDPGNPTYLDTYAYALYKNGQPESAKQNLLRAIQLFGTRYEPVPWEVHNHLGLVHIDLGENTQAIETFRKALNADRLPEKERKKIEDRITELERHIHSMTP